MQRVFVVAAVRSPIGKLGGALAGIRVDDLLGQVLRGLLFQPSICGSLDPAEIDDVIIGCANQAGEDNRNIARMSLILAGLPYSVPGTTTNRLCGSSLDSMMSGYARIRAGLADCIVAGGAESMTRGPYVLSKAETAHDRDQKMFDTTFGWRFPNKMMEKQFPLLSMGQTAEEVASCLRISRFEQDTYAYQSHQKALAARAKNLFVDEIVPIEVTSKRGDKNLVSHDESPRDDVSMEGLSKLRPVFKSESEGGTVTAGNACPMNDGASALLLASESFLSRYPNLRPIVEISGAAVRGVHPNLMGLGPVAAVNSLLQKFPDHKVGEFDIVEINEAFAAQAIGCIRQLDIDASKVNVNGGAIALGHALGCSGARIMTTMVHQMKRNNGLKHGLATMCIGVGQGIAVSVKSC
jgi:acetyl-CoA acyltransferase